MRRPAISTVIAFMLGSNAALASPNLARTYVVDKGTTGLKDYLTIQEAVDAVPSAAPRWTVLVYAGTYAESVTLDGPETRNIDIVGVGGVVISPPSGSPGIKIVGRTETTRMNSIRNVMIEAQGAHGIEIVKGDGPSDDPPAEMVLSEVRIDATGSLRDGLHAEEAIALDVRSCTLTGESYGVNAVNARSLRIRSSWLRGGRGGVRLTGGEDVRVSSGLSVGDSELGIPAYPTGGAVLASSAGNPPEAILLQGTRIRAIRRHDNEDAVGVNVAMEGAPRLLGCAISAEGTVERAGVVRTLNAYGVFVGGGTDIDPSVEIIGGTVRAASADTTGRGDVVDLRVENPSGHTATAFLAGTPIGRVSGAVAPAGWPRLRRQRLTDVEAANVIYVANVQVVPEPQIITTGITNPNHCRSLTVTRAGSALIGKDVGVFGKDLYLQDLAWSVTFVFETATHTSPYPFYRVERIAIPGVMAPGHKVRVGIAENLGHYAPLEGQAAILEQGRATSPSAPYLVETPGTVDVNGGTIDLSATLDDGDSFQHWVVDPN
jgi:hypothetical protein